jgi:CubicO group peptidase (beta-lactamase class C family)
VQATGESVLAYARAKLFDPLGIVTRPSVEPRITAQTTPQALAQYEKAGFAWPIDPQGFHLTESWIKLRRRDMAAFGQLFLQAGQWNGRQVVPATWVSQATTAQAGKAYPGGEAGENYGYFWWVQPAAGATAYAARGYGGQLVEVVPSLHLVIVVSSYVDETNPHAPVVGPHDLQPLVDAIVPIIKTHPTH